MEPCQHRRLEIDTEEGRYSCRDCHAGLSRGEADRLLRGYPLLRVVPDPPEPPDEE